MINEDSNVSHEYSHPDQSGELLRQFDLLRESRAFCDVVLVLDKEGVRVSAHRILLAANSDYFRSLFMDKTLESAANEFTLTEVHGDQLLPLIQFCYTGKIDLHTETVEKLLQAASHLKLNAVVHGCSEFMERNLNVSNSAGVFAIAELLSLSHLKQMALQYICNHFEQVSQLSEFQQLNIDQLKCLIASDELIVSTSALVFHSVMKWVQYDGVAERSKHIPALLTLMRLSDLPKDYLTGQVWDLCLEHGCQELLKQTIKEIIVSGDRNMKEKKSFPWSLAVALKKKNEDGLTIAIYSFNSDSWSTLDKISYDCSHFAVAVLDNEMFFLGGHDNTRSLTNFRSFNFDNKESKILPPMSLARSLLSVGVLNGHFYAAGGYENGIMSDISDKVECFNPTNCSWSDVVPMSVKRVRFGLAELDGYLFAVGGWNGSEDLERLDSTERYDPKVNKWTQDATLNIARCDFGIASNNGFLYVVGGESTTLSSVERYDLQLGKWFEICLMKSPLDYVNCFAVDDRLLVLGAKFGGELFSAFEEYNFLTRTWTQRASLNPSNANWACAVLKQSY